MLNQTGAMEYGATGGVPPESVAARPLMGDVVKRDGELAAAMRTLGAAAEQARAQATDLRGRLGPVLGGEGIEKDTPARVTYGCAAAQRLQKIEVEVAEVNAVLSDLLKRLEV